MKSLFYISLVLGLILFFGRSSHSANVVTTIDDGRYVVNVHEVKKRANKSFDRLINGIKKMLETDKKSKGDGNE